MRDRQQTPSKIHSQSPCNSQISRETRECGWVQINNVFVPYIVRMVVRDNEHEKHSTRQSASQLQREFYVPYEILIKCNIFSDQEFAFKKLLIKATHQDFDIFNGLISNINIFDEKVPEKTLLVNLNHVMIGLQRVLYIKFLTTKQPRTQVNKYHADVLIHKGGTLLMQGNRLIPYIFQNNRYYVPLLYAYQPLPNILSQAKRGARAPRQYEIDYLNLLLLYFIIDAPPFTSDTLLVDAFSIKYGNYQQPIHFRTLAEHQQHERNRLMNNITRSQQTNPKTTNKSQLTATKSSVASSNNKTTKCPPSNVVVNPLIHHPSFYVSQSSTSPARSVVSHSPTNSVMVNPSLLTSINESTMKIPPKQQQLRTIKYANQSINAIVKSSEIPNSEWKISIKHIFEKFSFRVDYEKFIQWCQMNSLLPLMKLDDEEKKIVLEEKIDDEYYVYHRHLDRCIALLNDLKRGTISMTLLPQVNHDVQSTSNKSAIAGAKKRKTTLPTTRHVQTSPTQPPPLVSSSLESGENQSLEMQTADHSIVSIEKTNTPTNETIDSMPVVVSTEEEEEEEEKLAEKLESDEMDTTFLIVESNDGEDGRIQLDDALPSCSSGYESAPAVTNMDINITHLHSSDEDDDDDINSVIRSREPSLSGPSEQSIGPMPNVVSLDPQPTSTEDENFKRKTPSPVIESKYSDHSLNQQNEKQSKVRLASSSPTTRYPKRKRLSNDQCASSPSSATTITSDQIEQHLRTLSMPSNEQRRTRTRPIKTPVRLVEEIASYHTSKNIEPDNNVFEILSSSPTTFTDTNGTKSSSIHEPTLTEHQSCVYNVTMSNKPNKLGLTIKKVVQR